jgi:6-phosphogluconolactonase (cycloisomerase 2 family)
MIQRKTALLLAAMATAACADNPVAAPDDFEAQFAATTQTGGHVYTMNNAAAGNEIVHYARAADGSLLFVANYPTGGTGTGAGLGNQGGIALSPGGDLLAVVNAGSNDFTLFRRMRDGSLAIVERESSGGTMPISVTIHGPRIFVLNAGGDGNISGFVRAPGGVDPIAGSTKPLSQSAPGPAQIQFTSSGHHLIVTEKMTNRILAYRVDASGVPSDAVVNNSAGATPFGFDIGHGDVIIVSEAVGGAPGAGLVSSYRLGDDGTLHTISPAVPDFQSAPCWIVITHDGRFAYTTNTASNSVSGYIVRGGQITLRDAGGVTASTDAAPIDAAIARGNGSYLYVLNGAAGTIQLFRIDSQGGLELLPGGAAGLPAGTNGLVAF